MNQTITWEDPGKLQIDLEDSVILAAAQKNPAAFQPLYQKWLKPVYRYFYFRVGNVKDAEDLTSQVFLKVMEDLPKYRNRGHFSGWLFTLAHARMVDHFRKGNREIELDRTDLVAGSPDLLEKASHDQEIARLFTVIRKLNDEEQELIRLRFFGELSYREIGQILHRREDAVRKSISRLLDRLQMELEEDHE